VSVDALTLASQLSRRAGDSQEAVVLLEQALASAKGLQAAPLHLSLTKLYEHSLKDCTRALHHARLTTAAESPEEQRHRISRLERKLARNVKGRAPVPGIPPPRVSL
jgi:hypothetical protein